MLSKLTNNNRALNSAAIVHFLIVPNDNADLDKIPDAIYCESPGDVVIRDSTGVELTYTMVQGQRLDFRGVRILETTTATIYGWK